jgi:transcriptional regulator with XRE-family HTH domain
MDMKQRFGDFIANRRVTMGITLRGMAMMLLITPGYLSDIEKGKRNPPEKPLLEKMARELKFNYQEKTILFDLAGIGRDEVPPDLPEYIKATDIVKGALRKAKDVATEDDWQQFIDKLNRKRNISELIPLQK